MMDCNKNYYVLAFYLFTPIENPQEEVAKHHAFFKDKDVKCRIYFSTEGINAQMSAKKEDAESYMQWLRADPRFQEIDVKIHLHHEHVFPKTTVKARQQLVALDQQVKAHEGGEHVPPEQWRKMLEQRDEHTVLLDVRNDYEWEIGHFEGAELPTLEQFREFPAFAKALKQQHDPKQTKVMMYCTGGIRCELYSALLKKEGYEHVYQLQGGVIKYGLEEGSKYWKGKLFVFDDRLSVPLNENEPAEIISCCHHCQTATDVYYNCANMDCNELFLCCPSCAQEFLGCCCSECKSAPRLRTYQQSERPKPFRKWPKTTC